MPKGGANKFRAGGNGRAGLRDIPANLRETLQFLAANPDELAKLPEAERITRTQQIAAWESQRRMRSTATKRGHANRKVKRDATAAAEFERQSALDVDELVAAMRSLMAHWGSSGYCAHVAMRATARLLAEAAVDGVVEIFGGDSDADEPLLYEYWLRVDAREAYCAILEAGVRCYEGLYPAFVASVERLHKRLDTPRRRVDPSRDVS